MMKFDVIIIGSGFGGACMAHSLSQAGFHTALVERGYAVARDQQDWDAQKILVEMRYAGNQSMTVSQYGQRTSLQRINEVLGGGSVFFGGACLRLRQNDFEAWPISYFEMEPYYCKAEKLLEVHGSTGNDPTEPQRSEDYPFRSPGLTNTAMRISNAAEKLRMHPFSMPMAINYTNDMRSLCESCTTCDGFPCKIGAKNDVVETVLKKCHPEKLVVLSGLYGLQLLESHHKIKRLECLDRESNTRVDLEAETFILAGGALESPALLMRSGLQHKDRSGALGHYLMRHCNAIVGCLFPYHINREGKNYKQICITDFYEDMRERTGLSVGVIQDMLMPPPAGSKHKAPWGLKTLSAHFNPYIQCLLCIAEDTPRYENRITLRSNQGEISNSRLHVHHEYDDGDIIRRNYLIKKAKKILKKAGGWFCVTQKIDSFSHAVGTTKFGSSSSKSVLDETCRYHAVKNLYVVDGGFMPTSGGVNPSLTIAANSLRVAEHIVERTKPQI